MHIKKHTILAIILFPLLFWSCVDADDIDVNRVVNIEVGASGLQNMILKLTVEIANESSTNFSIKESSFEVVRGDRVVAVAKVNDKIEIKRGINELVIPVNIEMRSSLLEMLTIKKDLPNLHYNFQTTAMGFLFRKNIKATNLTFEELKRMVNIDLNQILLTN